MKVYRAWIPAQESERVGYGHRKAYDASDAAEEYVESQYHPEDGDAVTVHVRDVETNVVKVFVVHVDYEPSFSAREVGE